MKRNLFNFLIISTIIISNSVLPTTNVDTLSSPKLLVVGDSLADSGAFHGIINQLAQSRVIKCSKMIPFQEMKMLEPLNSNSICNGTVFTKKIAEHFQVPFDPAWKFRICKLLNFEKKGNNYAVVGAQATKRNDQYGKLLNNFTINKQVNALLHQHQINNNDIIIFEIGANDIMYAWEKNETERNEILNKSLKKQEKAWKKLIAKNAKKIIVFNIPPLALIPQYKNRDTTDLKIIINTYNEKLEEKINKLNHKYGNILKIFDINTKMQDSLVWFKTTTTSANTTDPATIIDYNLEKTNGILKPQYNICDYDNLKNYYWFDPWHPTTIIHQYFADQLINH